MEQNHYEELEAVEQEENVLPETEEIKEYEKLLGYERARQDYERAVNLIKFGCFKQDNFPTVDFSKLEKISTEKKYKGLYDLYRDLETMDLVFILPLVENNKGDVDEKKDMKPYAYDVIRTEAMDSETYEMVKKAAKNNLKNPVFTFYKFGKILYYVLIVLAIYTFIYNFISCITSSSYDFFSALAMSLFYSSSFFVGIVISTFVLVLTKIKVNKYKDN